MMGVKRRVVVWLAILLVVVWGQNSNIDQCIPSYNWTMNSQNQTPCLVAAYLESGCGMAARVDGIPPGTHYIGPSSEDASGCYCSTVTYSVMSACAGCQNRSYLNWTTWSYNCTVKYESSYPGTIPAGTSVPLWAYLNPSETSDTFDPVVAARNVSIVLPSTFFSTRAAASTVTPSFVLSSSAVPSTTAHSSNSSTAHLGAILGGALGGSVGLAIILLVLLLWYLRRRSNAPQNGVVFDRTALVSGTPTTTSGTSFGPSQGNNFVTMQNATGSPLFTSSPSLPNSPYSMSRRSLDGPSPSIRYFGPTLQPNRYPGFRTDTAHGHVQV